MQALLVFLGLFFCNTTFAQDSSSERGEQDSPPFYMEHAPFKERVWIGPGYRPGVDNVLKGYLEAGTNAEFLVSKNIGNQPIGWRCGIDPYTWFMFNASNMENRVFDLQLKNPLHLVLEADGRLHIVDVNYHDVWSRGPYGPSDSYQLMVSDEGPGDLILYNGAGQAVWSVRRDGL